MKIIFYLSILIKTVQKIVRASMSKIGTTYRRVMVNTVPESGQPLFRYRTKFGTTYGQAPVPKDKHIKTGINKTNRIKLENKKKRTSFLKFFIKFFKKWKLSNRYKFYGTKVFKTKKAVGQNSDKFRTTAFLKIFFFKNYLLLFLAELFPNVFSLNCFCSFCISTLTFRSTTLA